MFGVGVGIRVGGFTPISGGGGFDPDAQAFFDRVTTAGGTLTTTEQNATNQLVLDMKSAGIWSSMKAIYPMVGASAAACAQNLKSSSFTGTFSSGWTFASTGVTGNGTSAYMNTGLPPSTMSQNSIHLSYYSRTNNTTNAVEMGTVVNNSSFLSVYYNSGSYINLNSNTAIFPVTNSLGMYIAYRNSADIINLLKNSTLQTPQIQPTGSPDTVNIYIGGRNANPSVNLPTNRQCAFSSIGDGLTDTQASNFYTAVQAMQTTLSRQV